MYIIVDLNYIQAAAEIDKNWRSVSRTYRFMIVDFTYFRDGKLEEDVERTRGCSFFNFNFTICQQVLTSYCGGAHPSCRCPGDRRHLI